MICVSNLHAFPFKPQKIALHLFRQLPWIMIRQLASLILRIGGWKFKGHFPYEVKKCIIMMAPHTSNWDYIIGRLFFFKINVPVKFLIKREIFVFPIGALIKYWGGIPVERKKKKNNLVNFVARLFRENEELYVVVTPEGTRKLVKQWRKGFYHIALKAKVPLALSYIDYAKKEGGVMEVFQPTGDYEKDMEHIFSLYRDKTARHPEQFNLTQNQ